MLKNVVLAGGTRTAIGGFQGSLSTLPAPQLGGIVIKAALERAGVAPEAVDEVIAGNVLPAGLGQNVARQAALAAGLSPAVGATTVNKVCGSSLKAVMLAAQAIQCGDAEIVLAAGMENMSLAPYLLPKARAGYRMGHGEIIDSMIHDGLWDVYNSVHMGTCGDTCAEKYQFSRQAQDDFAVASYTRALEVQKSDAFAREIVPVEILGKKGNTIVAADEEPQRFNEEKLRSLRPAFGKEGTVTAGNASSISDGAAAIVVLDAEKAQKLGVTPQGANPGLQHPFPGTGVVLHRSHRRHRQIDGLSGLANGRRRFVRDQRSLFRRPHGGHEGLEHPPRQGQRPRRSRGARSSHRRQRGQSAGYAAERVVVARRPAGNRFLVHRRRRGGGAGRGTRLNPRPQASSPEVPALGLTRDGRQMQAKSSACYRGGGAALTRGDGDVGTGRRADVLSRGTQYFAGAALLDDMRRPARGPRADKQRCEQDRRNL